MRRAVSLVGLSFILVSGAFALPARASCVPVRPMPKEIEASPAVFVGTVVQVENERRWATVDVTDVWKGEVAERVEVRGGPKDPPGSMAVATSVDRSYKPDQTYLFVPYKGAGTTFRDNICTRTTVYRPELVRFRPASATTTSPEPASPAADDEGTATWIFVPVGLVVVGIVVLVAKMLGGRNGPRPPD